MFISWAKEGAENKEAVENSTIDANSRRYLRGGFPIIRKIRTVRLIRKIIEEGISIRGVREMYEEGMRLLLEIGKKGAGGIGGEEEEEEKLMGELCLLKYRGEEKKIKEDEVGVLRRELEEEKRKREEAERKASEEKRRLEETIKQMRVEMEGMKKRERKEKQQGVKEKKRYYPPITLITSLGGISVIFPKTDGIKREGNTIIHHGSNSFRNCFIGGEMISV